MPVSPCMIFELQTTRIAIGDPVMGMAHYDLPGMVPGLYSLKKGCLKEPKDDSQAEQLDLDSVYLYVVDAAHEEAFTESFHRLGNACGYVTPEMQNRHHELEQPLGVRVGFYWIGELTGKWEEGQFELDVRRIKKIAK